MLFDRTQMNDTLTSLIGGLGDPGRDKLAGAEYTRRHLTDEQLRTVYASSWMVRKAVNIPAHDATRKWRAWQGEDSDVAAMIKTETALDLKRKVRQAKVLARLYGGSAIVIGDGAENVKEPLDVERMGRGDLKYLSVIPRLDLQADQLVRDPSSPLFAKPGCYRFSNGTGTLEFHPSRLAIFEGSECVDPWRQVGHNLGWGDSIIPAIYDAMKHGDSTLANVASLVFEANVDVIKTPDLMSKSNDPVFEANFIKRSMLAAAAKGINKTLILDDLETYDRKSANFSALDKIIDQFLRVCAGAADIPMTRFMAQSPAGLSATGEGDMKNYYDMVQTIQSTELSPSLATLDRAMQRSTFGVEPEGLTDMWSALEQMSEKDQAEIGAKHAETASKLIMAGVYDADEMAEALTTVLTEIGVYPNLATIIAAAEERGADDTDLGGVDPLDPQPENTSGANPIGEDDLELRETAFNGAQIASLLQLLNAAAADELPRETVIEVILTSFPGVTRGIISRMIGPLSNFVPASARNEAKKEATVAEDAALWLADYTPDASSTPKTLYAYRKVMNGAAIARHYEAQGVKVTLPIDDLHVTLIYSKTPVDWLKIGSPWDAELKIPAGGARIMQGFGEALVLSFANSDLEWRHARMVDNGASFDFPEYTPHVTISYGEDVDPDTVEAYQGEIILGPETFQIIDLDNEWSPS